METTVMATYSKETGKAAIPLGERVKLLAGVPAFALVPTRVLEELGACLKEEFFAEKSAIIFEGEVCDRVYLIAQGRVELSTVGASGSVPLATLTVGETFGETLNRQTIPRTADYHPTVRAITPLLTLTLAQADLEKVLAAYPLARGAMIYSAQKLTAKFLKEASPFLSLEPKSTVKESMESSAYATTRYSAMAHPVKIGLGAGRPERADSHALELLHLMGEKP